MYLDFDKEISEISWEGNYRPKCTITEVPFDVDVKLSYTPNKKIIEFIEFEKKMKETLEDQIMIIEDLPSLIINEILKDLNPKAVEVEVFASTPVHNDVSSKLSK